MSHTEKNSTKSLTILSTIYPEAYCYCAVCRDYFHIKTIKEDPFCKKCSTQLLPCDSPVYRTLKEHGEL